MNLDAFCSEDLLHWEKREGIVEMADFPWIWRAVWAPTITRHRSRYYLIFASNDIQSDQEYGDLEITVADQPGGLFRGYLGRLLLDRFISGAQPIDTHLFKDDDGTVYLYYGGGRHCNVARMNEDMTGFVPFTNGECFLPITPEGYVEGPCKLKRDNVYYLMWSMGNWVDESYCVAYGVSDNPLGPFDNRGTILQRQEPVTEGPGHHGFLHLPESDKWLIVYHRLIIGDSDHGSRILYIDRLKFDSGIIKPVRMTDGW